MRTTRVQSRDMLVIVWTNQKPKTQTLKLSIVNHRVMSQDDYEIDKLHLLANDQVNWPENWDSERIWCSE